MNKTIDVGLKQMLDNGDFILVPSCSDPLTSLIAEKSGHQAVALGGYAFGAQSAVTEPLLTMSEVVEAARRIVSLIKIPLIVDGGAGFGDATHVTRTIREMEQVGVSGVHIEDQLFPKRAHYHREYQERVISADEMVDKISYALRARSSEDFLIIARTDSMRTHGYEEGVRRANLYARAGADMIMLFPNNRHEAEAAPRDVLAPAIYVNSFGNRADRPVFGVSELKTFGYRMLLDAIGVPLTHYVAVERFMEELKRHGGANGFDGQEAIEARLRLENAIGLDFYYDIEENTVERKK